MVVPPPVGASHGPGRGRSSCCSPSTELGKWAELGWSTWLAYGAIVVLVSLAALRPRRLQGLWVAEAYSLRPRDRDLSARTNTAGSTQTSHRVRPLWPQLTGFCTPRSDKHMIDHSGAPLLFPLISGWHPSREKSRAFYGFSAGPEYGTQCSERQCS